MMNTETLTPTPPFDFAHTLRFIGLFPPTLGQQQLGDLALTKAFMVKGETVVVEVRSLGTVAEPSLSYTLHSTQPASAELRVAVADRVSFYLSLADDLRPFYELGKSDPVFAPIVERLYGFHQVKFPSPFENAVWAILTQRNPMAIAQKMKQRLIDAYGGSLTVHGTEYKSFPDALRLASAPPDEIRTLVHNEQKTPYVIAAANAFANADEGFLRYGDYDEVAKWLRNIKGIGAWSSTFILIRGLGRTEQISDEKALKMAASKYYGHADLKRAAEHYGPYQGYWAFYLRNAG
jgi:DNA-3-methyladenine glycosylase II